MPDKAGPKPPAFDPQVFLAAAPDRPGVYIFFDAEGGALYVGKARNLKKRLRSYFLSLIHI